MSDYEKDIPQLETNRLVLRKMVKEDSIAVQQHFADEEVTQFLKHRLYSTSEEVEDFIQWSVEQFENKKGIRWGVFLRDNHVLIGTCSLNKLNFRRKKAELEFDISSPYWNKGYMEEALHAVFNYSFRMMNLHRIEALILPTSSEALSLLESLDFNREGVLRDHNFINNQFCDEICFSLLEERGGGEQEKGT